MIVHKVSHPSQSSIQVDSGRLRQSLGVTAGDIFPGWLVPPMLLVPDLTVSGTACHNEETPAGCIVAGLAILLGNLCHSSNHHDTE